MLEELLIEGYVQPTVEVVAKQAPELGSDTGQTTFVDVNHCGMPVGVGIYTGFGMDDGDIPEDVVIRAEPSGRGLEAMNACSSSVSGSVLSDFF